MTKSIGIENFNLCPECGGYTNSNFFRGEETCSQCGLVIDEGIFSLSDTGKRYLDNDKKSSSFHRKNLTIYQKRVLKKDAWVGNFQRNLKEAHTTIDRICGNLRLPKIIKYETKYLYKKVLKKRLVQGYSIKGMVCACIYHSCKNHYPLRLKEITQQIEGLVNKTKNPVKHVRNCYTIIAKELKLKHQSKGLLSSVPRFISEADLDEKMINLTTKFLVHCNAEYFFNGKDPAGVVAAAIYLVGKKCGFYISQAKLAKIAGVTENTIRSRMKEFQKII